MNTKRYISILLAVVMVLSLAACGGAPAASAPAAEQPAAPAAAPAAEAAPASAEQLTAAPPAAGPNAGQVETPAPGAVAALEMSDVDIQLALIQSKISGLLQPEGELPWYYTVADLNRDGSLELIAASQHPQDRSDNLHIWEVNAERNELVACTVEKDPEESFPDMLVPGGLDTYHDGSNWYYMLYDNVILSDTEVYTNKCAFLFKDGKISYLPYAIEHTVVENAQRTVDYMTPDGTEITAEQYNNAGTSAFADAARSNTSFSWLTAEQAKDLDNLTDTFSVFMGRKKAPESFPVPVPSALQHPAATPAPAATPVPTATPEPKPTYLSITKNPTNENKKSGATALFVACANAYDSLEWTLVSPDGGWYTPQQFAGMFVDAPVSGYYSTTLSIGNVAWDMNGWGAFCTFYYRGQTSRTSTAYLYVTQPVPESEGYVNGSVLDWNYAYVSIWTYEGTNVLVDWNLVSLTGDIQYGSPVTYYWRGNKNNITICYIEGAQPAPQPQYGSMSGYAYSGGGGYAIDLSNGAQVFVDAWNCSVDGNFYEGCPAIVYYMDYPSNANIYWAELYGSTVYEDQGGWAGSQYYNNQSYETGNFIQIPSFGYVSTHDSPNGDGTYYEAFWCPNCGTEVSLAYDCCPGCGILCY